ncbi:MAG TPA: MerR family transcriptional regulator [Dehalococcoidia bacterium]|nr:MerR family transcriptional regulator [Dehalococcoidia bacterium]
MLTIGRLAARSGVPVSTLRYYERLGLLSPQRRSEGGFRLYSEEALGRLRFIRGAQALGIPLRDVRRILAVRDEGLAPCRHVLELLRGQVRRLEEQLARLAALRGDLEELLRELEARVAPEARTAEECPCLEVIAEFERRREGMRRGL